MERLKRMDSRTDDDLATVSAQIRGVEQEVAKRLGNLERLSKDEKAELTAQVKRQRATLKALKTSKAARAAIEKAEAAASEEHVSTLKALHFPGFAPDNVVGEPGAAFVGMRDVWLETLHASAKIHLTSTPWPTLELELGAPTGDASDSDGGAVLSAHVGTLRVWGDVGSRIPTLNVRKGARVQMRARVIAEVAYVTKDQAKERAKVKAKVVVAPASTGGAAGTGNPLNSATAAEAAAIASAMGSLVATPTAASALGDADERDDATHELLASSLRLHDEGLSTHGGSSVAGESIYGEEEGEEEEDDDDACSAVSEEAALSAEALAAMGLELPPPPSAFDGDAEAALYASLPPSPAAPLAAASAEEASWQVRCYRDCGLVCHAECQPAAIWLPSVCHPTVPSDCHPTATRLPSRRSRGSSSSSRSSTRRSSLRRRLPRSYGCSDRRSSARSARPYRRSSACGVRRRCPKRVGGGWREAACVRAQHCASTAPRSPTSTPHSTQRQARPRATASDGRCSKPNRSWPSSARCCARRPR